MNNTVDEKTELELLKSLLAEAAKSSNELRCAKQDINKALGRLEFSIMVINTMIDRHTNPINRGETNGTI
jgi:hypothetical protein